MLVGVCFTATQKSLQKLFFHISLDLYLDHSIIIVSLDSDIKRLASSTAFIHWPLILTPSWNQAPPRGKKACKKNWRARRAELGTGEGEELRAFFPHFPHQGEEPGPRLLSFQRESKGTRDAGPAMCCHLKNVPGFVTFKIFGFTGEHPSVNSRTFIQI